MIKCCAVNAGNNTFLFLLSDFSVSGRQVPYIRNKDRQRVCWGWVSRFTGSVDIDVSQVPILPLKI
jgi:hypothetical protein